MKNKFFLTKIVLIINTLFWSGIAVYYSFFKFVNKPNYLILKVLLFGEPILFIISIWNLVKKNRFIYLLSILFVITNGVLSITDQVGNWDLISLILNILAMVGLISVWKEMMTKTQD